MERDPKQERTSKTNEEERRIIEETKANGRIAEGNEGAIIEGSELNDAKEDEFERLSEVQRASEGRETEREASGSQENEGSNQDNQDSNIEKSKARDKRRRLTSEQPESRGQSRQDYTDNTAYDKPYGNPTSEQGTSQPRNESSQTQTQREPENEQILLSEDSVTSTPKHAPRKPQNAKALSIEIDNRKYQTERKDDFREMSSLNVELQRKILRKETESEELERQKKKKEFELFEAKKRIGVLEGDLREERSEKKQAKKQLGEFKEGVMEFVEAMEGLSQTKGETPKQTLDSVTDLNKVLEAVFTQAQQRKTSSLQFSETAETLTLELAKIRKEADQSKEFGKKLEAEIEKLKSDKQELEQEKANSIIKFETIEKERKAEKAVWETEKETKIEKTKEDMRDEMAKTILELEERMARERGRNALWGEMFEKEVRELFALGEIDEDEKEQMRMRVMERAQQRGEINKQGNQEESESENGNENEVEEEEEIEKDNVQNEEDRENGNEAEAEKQEEDTGSKSDEVEGDVKEANQDPQSGEILETKPEKEEDNQSETKDFRETTKVDLQTFPTLEQEEERIIKNLFENVESPMCRCLLLLSEFKSKIDAAQNADQDGEDPFDDELGPKREGETGDPEKLSNKVPVGKKISSKKRKIRDIFKDHSECHEENEVTCALARVDQEKFFKFGEPVNNLFEIYGLLNMKIGKKNLERANLEWRKLEADRIEQEMQPVLSRHHRWVAKFEMIKDINENTIEMKSEEFIEMERGEDSESDLKDEEVLNDHVQSLNGTIKRLSKNVEFEKRVFIREIDAMKIEIQNTRNIIENLRNVSTFRMFLKDNSPFCAKTTKAEEDQSIENNLERLKMYIKNIRSFLKRDLEQLVAEIRLGNETKLDSYNLKSLQFSLEQIGYYSKNQNLSAELRMKIEKILELENQIKQMLEKIEELEQNLEASQNNETGLQGLLTKVTIENDRNLESIRDLEDFKKKTQKEAQNLDSIKQILESEKRDEKSNAEIKELKSQIEKLEKKLMLINHNLIIETENKNNIILESDSLKLELSNKKKELQTLQKRFEKKEQKLEKLERDHQNVCRTNDTLKIENRYVKNQSLSNSERTERIITSKRPGSDSPQIIKQAFNPSHRLTGNQNDLNENDQTVNRGNHLGANRRFQNKPQVPNNGNSQSCCYVVLAVVLLLLVWKGSEMLNIGAGREVQITSTEGIQPGYDAHSGLNSQSGKAYDRDIHAHNIRGDSTGLGKGISDTEQVKSGSKQERETDTNSNEKTEYIVEGTKDASFKTADGDFLLRDDSRFQRANRNDLMGDEDSRYRRVNFQVYEEEFE